MVTEQPLRLWINGISGKMGKELFALCTSNPQYVVVGCTDSKGNYLFKNNALQACDSDHSFLSESIDIILDFSSVASNAKLLTALSRARLEKPPHVLIATTGLTQKTLREWRALATATPILEAPNTSLGVLVTLHMAQQIAKILRPQGFDIEIIESHHRAKADSPSGTAKLLADSLANQEQLCPQYGRQGPRRPSEIGIASVRGGAVLGDHEIRFLGDLEEVTISHRALSRQLFAKGALALTKWLAQAQIGFHRVQDLKLDELVL